MGKSYNTDSSYVTVHIESDPDFVQTADEVKAELEEYRKNYLEYVWGKVVEGIEGNLVDGACIIERRFYFEKALYRMEIGDVVFNVGSEVSFDSIYERLKLQYEGSGWRVELKEKKILFGFRCLRYIEFSKKIK